MNETERPTKTQLLAEYNGLVWLAKTDSPKLRADAQALMAVFKTKVTAEEFAWLEAVGRASIVTKGKR